MISEVDDNKYLGKYKNLKNNGVLKCLKKSIPLKPKRGKS